jgi:hypothetical protein
LPVETEVEPSLLDRAIAEDQKQRDLVDSLVNEWVFQDITSPFSLFLQEVHGIESALANRKDVEALSGSLSLFVSFGLYDGETPLEPLRLSSPVPLSYFFFIILFCLNI